MLTDQPDLRVVAATDNPAIHRTETAFLAASADTRAAVNRLSDLVR